MELSICLEKSVSSEAYHEDADQNRTFADHMEGIDQIIEGQLDFRLDRGILGEITPVERPTGIKKAAGP